MWKFVAAELRHRSCLDVSGMHLGMSLGKSEAKIADVKVSIDAALHRRHDADASAIRWWMGALRRSWIDERAS